MSFLDKTFRALLDVLVQFERGVSTTVYGVTISVAGPLSRRHIDERLAKIEDARHNMAEAIQALDELQRVAEENKRDLDAINSAISAAEADKVSAEGKVKAAKQLAEIDAQAARSVLELPTAREKWKERVYGFVSGVGASLLAAIIWKLFVG